MSSSFDDEPAPRKVRMRPMTCGRRVEQEIGWARLLCSFAVSPFRLREFLGLLAFLGEEGETAKRHAQMSELSQNTFTQLEHAGVGVPLLPVHPHAPWHF